MTKKINFGLWGFSDLKNRYWESFISNFIPSWNILTSRIWQMYFIPRSVIPFSVSCKTGWIAGIVLVTNSMRVVRISCWIHHWLTRFINWSQPWLTQNTRNIVFAFLIFCVVLLQALLVHRTWKTSLLADHFYGVSVRLLFISRLLNFGKGHIPLEFVCFLRVSLLFLSLFLIFLSIVFLI